MELHFELREICFMENEKLLILPLVSVIHQKHFPEFGFIHLSVFK